MIRILVADGHTIMRRGLRGCLETHADWHVCGEAGNGREAVEMTIRSARACAIIMMTQRSESVHESARPIHRATL